MDEVRGEVAPRGGGEGGSVWKKMGVPAPSPASGSCLSGAVGA